MTIQLLSSKLATITHERDGLPISVQHFTWCPGCQMIHPINVTGCPQDGPKWSFDGNAQAPTFGPSVKVDLGRNPGATCHYFVRAGQIQFCGDSTHALAGKTVPLPDIPDDWRD
nr:DUF6527 family protein [Acetobacter sacchari]